jgi:formamidopyrimidine-DNA glycosylase
MPELPEVETIARNLRQGEKGGPSLIDKRIGMAHIYWERTLVEPAPDEFIRRIAGQVIQKITRRGKFLIFQLSADTLLIHLRMSGDLLIEPVSTPPDRHQRLSLDLDKGWRLSFVDPRKFGRAWLVTDPQTVLTHLGPEPLDPELTSESFYQMLQKHTRQLKPLLIDQAFLAGLGNIYVDEALHLAKLHPQIIASTLDGAKAAQLLSSIRLVLEEAIFRNGASIDWVYRGGDFQNHFRAYQRTGEPCPLCGTPIARMIVGQRGTHYCPTCQKL